MDRNSVLEFLGQIPRLQTLPSVSVRRIADIVQVRQFDPDEYIVREGETGEGLYFIWEGKASVSGSSDAVDGTHSQSQLQLMRYDYFGCTSGSDSQICAIALTKLTCLVLPTEHRGFLLPKSIWSADEPPQDISIIEQLLYLEPIEVNIFRGHTLPEAPSFEQVYGGQLVAQALAAASKTVDCLKLVHGLHSYFLFPGEKNLPIIYEVHRARDGCSFATRRVDAKQHGNVIFTLIVSFQKEEVGFEHQERMMPHVPPPETVETIAELSERHPSDLWISRYASNKVVGNRLIPCPMEFRLPEENFSEKQFRPSFKYWFRVRGNLSDDPALHRCVLAYISDFHFGIVSLKPHLRKDMKILSLSLDHAIWFHRPIKADEWLLFESEGPSAYGGRGFNTGRFFNRKGELVVSITQEALYRKMKPSKHAPKPKL